MSPLFRSPLAGRCVAFWIALWMAVGTLCAESTSADAADLRTMRLRLEWGGKRKSLWSGLIELSQGRFADASSLSVEADEPGTLWIEGNAVWIQRRTVRVYDGFDISVTAPATATLNVSLKSAHHAASKSIAIPLAKIDSQGIVEALDDVGTRLVVRRTPGDELPIRVDRSHLVFDPGETLRCQVQAAVPAARWARGNGSITWRIAAARGGAVLERGGVPIQVPAEANGPITVPVEIPLPAQEGAWDVQFAVSGVGWDKPKSTVQVIVIDPHRVHERADSERQPPAVVDSFSPADAASWRVLRTDDNPRSWTSALRRMIGLADDEQSVESAERAAIQWQAWHVKVRAAGTPHLLVVQARANSGTCLGISILEPNAFGQLMPVGLDSGMADSRGEQSRSGAAAEAARDDAGVSTPKTVEHRLLFWPKTEKPIVLVHDLGAGTPFAVEKVELLQLGALEVNLPQAAVPPMAVGGPAIPRRLVGPYLHKPMLPENFGAAEALDAASRRSLDDWHAFHTAGTRLVEYLRHTGSNSLLLAVLADGSTIYPSALLQPTPRYDTGSFFSTGQDVLRKDVVEMLLRLFQRSGLQLVPELQFSAPLPALERELSLGRESSHGIELIGSDGRSWREARGTNRGLAPHYNPLDPRVQQAVCDVVEEFAARYREHPALAGIAVELSSEGYLLLPGLNWGYDDATIARFERQSGLRVPTAGDVSRFAIRHQYLTTTARAEWVRWRCAELAKFHMRLANIVQQYLPHGVFVLSANRLLRGPNLDDSLEESTALGSRLDSLLPPKGLDFSEYSRAGNLVVLSPALWESPTDSRATAWEESVNFSASLAEALGPVQHGRLCYHEPVECRIEDFDRVSPWQPAYTWLAAHVSPIGVHSRERWVRSLADDAQMVFDGGWMTMLGQEHHALKLRRILGALPAVPLHPVKSAPQPLVVRIGRAKNQAFVVIANELSQPVQAQLTLSHAGGATLEPLGGTDGYRVAGGDVGAGSVLLLELDAYDACAFRVADPNTRVQQVRLRVPDETRQRLTKRIDQLERWLLASQTSPPGGAIALNNPGFESGADARQPLPGWQVDEGSSVQWAVDTREARSGKQALMLASAQEAAASVSSPLPVINERMVTLSVWLKSDRPQTAVRLAFEATIDSQMRTQSVLLRVDTEWKRYVFRIRDLPARSLQDARLRVGLDGPGRIWVDDAEVDVHRLSEDDIRQLTKLSSAVRLAWSENRYVDCERLLNSHWVQLLAENAAPPEPAPEDAPAREKPSPPRKRWPW